MTPDGKRNASAKNDAVRKENSVVSTSTKPPIGQEEFFEMLTRTQSKRMDDQRCSLKVIGHSQSQTSQEPPIRKPLVQQNSLPALPTIPQQSTKEKPTALLDLIADLQSERMDEQRAPLPQIPCHVPSTNQSSHQNLLNNQTTTTTALNSRASSSIGQPAPDDNFFDMLARYQGSRIDEQRSVVSFIF